jgi:hypothetical protein
MNQSNNINDIISTVESVNRNLAIYKDSKHLSWLVAAREMAWQAARDISELYGKEQERRNVPEQPVRNILNVPKV